MLIPRAVASRLMAFLATIDREKLTKNLINYLGVYLMTELIGLALLIIYGGGLWKFWQGFERTSFDRSFPNRLKMSLLWPALIFNRSYRQNFTKALKGSNKGY